MLVKSNSVGEYSPHEICTILLIDLMAKKKKYNVCFFLNKYFVTIDIWVGQAGLVIFLTFIIILFKVCTFQIFQTDVVPKEL